MPELLKLVNEWFAQIGLNTDWTVTWDGLLAFGTAAISLIVFTIKWITNQVDPKPTKSNLQAQQQEVFQDKAAVFFGGEVILILKWYTEYENRIKGTVKFTNKNMRHIQKDFELYADASSSFSFQGFNDYQLQINSFEKNENSDEYKAVVSIILMPRNIRFFKNLGLITFSLTVALLAHAILISRFGNVIFIKDVYFSAINVQALREISFPTLLLSLYVFLITWILLKIKEMIENSKT